MSEIICPICNRNIPEKYQEKHHLVPHRRRDDIITVCVNCGDAIHQLIDNRDLKSSYNTIERLKLHEGIQKWVKWIRKKPNEFSVAMASKKRK